MSRSGTTASCASFNDSTNIAEYFATCLDWRKSGSSLSAWAYLVTWVLVIAGGCGQTASSPDASQPQVSDAKAGDNQYDVKVTRAEGKLAPANTRPASAEGEPASLPLEGPVLPLDDTPAESLSMPKVFLSESHAKLCRVKVGDAFPDFELPDFQSQKQHLGDLLGKKVTVIVFWNGKQPMALEELADLGPQIDKRFADDGVAVVGINVSDDPQLAAELCKKASAGFVNLSDRDGAALEQVGTGKIPRTYLVDASGKIVWFDIEYSRSTRRDLTQAIRYLLAQP